MPTQSWQPAAARAQLLACGVAACTAPCKCLHMACKCLHALAYIDSDSAIQLQHIDTTTQAAPLQHNVTHIHTCRPRGICNARAVCSIAGLQTVPLFVCATCTHCSSRQQICIETLQCKCEALIAHNALQQTGQQQRAHACALAIACALATATTTMRLCMHACKRNVASESEQAGH